MTLSSIDFGQRYREHFAAAQRRPKGAATWDARAASLGQKTHKSSYAQAFIERMNLSGASSLLDVGCGPGAICLPLAAQLDRVIGLDFSQGMLDELLKQAVAQGSRNVEALHLSWEDDWSRVPVCDIVVASRSTMVADMAAALHKLNDKARLRVYLTHVVGGGHFNAMASEVIGREIPTLPDYIYVLNILHQVGLHPRLDFIEHQALPRETDSFREFARRAAWALNALSAAETARLQGWYTDTLKHPDGPTLPLRWAFISWDKHVD